MEIGGLPESTSCLLLAFGVVGVVIAALLFYRALCRKKLQRRSSSTSGFTEFGTMASNKKCHLSTGDDSDSSDEGFEGEDCPPELPWGEDAERRLYCDVADSQWANDAAGLVPLCIDLLRSTQCLIEYLMELAREKIPGKNWKLIVESADDLNPLVDAVVQSMYPPLDSRVLIVRATELVISARHVAELVVGGPPVKGLGSSFSSSSASSQTQASNSGSSLLALPGLVRRRHGQVAKLVSAAERSLQALRMAAPGMPVQEQEAYV